jgi:hypothetical protein
MSPVPLGGRGAQERGNIITRKHRILYSAVLTNDFHVLNTEKNSYRQGYLIFCNLDRVDICIDKAVKGDRIQPPGFFKHMHKADPDERRTGMFVNN